MMNSIIVSMEQKIFMLKLKDLMQLLL